MKKLGVLGLGVMLLSCGCGLSETKAVDAKASHVDVVWLTSLDAARKEAAEKKLPILVNFSGSDWCGWCIKLDKEVFSQKAFAEYAKSNLVLLLLDFPNSKPQSPEDKKVNQALAEQYGVQGFPTVLLLDATGKQLGRTGYMPGGAEAYVDHLKDLLKKK